MRARARASKDLDAVFRRSLEEIVAALDATFTEPFAGFVLRRHGEAEPLADKAARLHIRLGYAGRTWATVPLEVSPTPDADVETEELPALDLAEFGLAGPSRLHCLSLRYQIAQKIHAVTKPPTPELRNDRFRDLVDLYLLKDLVEDLPGLRAACERVFEMRQGHTWPPVVFVLAEWVGPLGRLVRDLGLPVDVESLGMEVEALIALITSATGTSHNG